MVDNGKDSANSDRPRLNNQIWEKSLLVIPNAVHIQWHINFDRKIHPEDNGLWGQE